LSCRLVDSHAAFTTPSHHIHHITLFILFALGHTQFTP
jgi:hypothetical protein